jgi:hypothetical protein
MVWPSTLGEAWDHAHQRYADIDADVAAFNTALLAALRDRWEQAVRPDTSMFTLLFTRPGETGDRFTERVEVEWQGPSRVAMVLVRDAPRISPAASGGPWTVTGDMTRPENALPAVEALLLQLADPVDLA